jgi:site-specific DNA-methyltransferase (adenine-specific)
VTQPYYQDDLVTLYHGDCREITEWLNADVLVTDPPYGIAYESNFNRDKRNTKVGRAVEGDQDPAIRDTILATWGDRPALVFGRWDAPRPADTRARLVWDKGNSVGMGDLKMPWGRSDEEIYVLGRGFTGSRSGSVIRSQMLMSGDRNRPDHPTPKPVGLMETLIAKCPPGTVADPFAGSGSTLLAAKLQGRRAIGVEFEERYCALMATRLSQDALPFLGTA